MPNIINFLYRLYQSFSDRQPTQKQNIITDHIREYISEIRFELTEDENIDISYFLPDINNRSLDDLSKLAEKYAKFLMAINEGYLRDDIIKVFSDNIKKSENPQDHLFWDNVMVYWSMLHVESIKNQKHKEKKDQPLIRPISVFNRIEN